MIEPTPRAVSTKPSPHSENPIGTTTEAKTTKIMNSPVKTKITIQQSKNKKPTPKTTQTQLFIQPKIKIPHKV